MVKPVILAHKSPRLIRGRGNKQGEFIDNGSHSVLQTDSKGSIPLFPTMKLYNNT